MTLSHTLVAQGESSLVIIRLGRNFWISFSLFFWVFSSRTEEQSIILMLCSAVVEQEASSKEREITVFPFLYSQNGKVGKFIWDGPKKVKTRKTSPQFLCRSWTLNGEEKNANLLSLTGSSWHGPHADLFLRWIMTKNDWDGGQLQNLIPEMLPDGESELMVEPVSDMSKVGIQILL